MTPELRPPTSPSPAQAAVVWRHWSARTGVPAAAFRRAGTTVHVRPDEELHGRVVLRRTARAAVVMVPATLAARLGAALLAPAGGARASAERLAAAWPEAGLRLRWRDFLTYLDPGAPRPAPDGAVRRLEPGDAPALAELAAACSPRERALAQVAISDPVGVGVFEGRRLLGVATLLFQGAEIADVGVLTRPDARGRGVARRAGTLLAWLGQRRGRTMQYSTQEDNPASLRVAAALGYRLWLTEEGFEVGRAR